MRNRSALCPAITSVVLATSAVLMFSPAGAAPPAPTVAKSAHRTFPTSFALQNQTYGSVVQGGDAPVGSAPTAYQAIGCTNRVGVAKTNYTATDDLPGLGEARGVYTRNLTTRQGSVISSISQHDTNGVELSKSAIGVLELTDIDSFSRAFHDTRGFHSETRTSVGSVRFTPTGGQPVNYRVPSPGRPVTIPGYGTLTAGTSHEYVNRERAYAAADALVITSASSGTRTRISHTAARISSGITVGTFRGRANATQARAQDDSFRSGPNPLSLMPCQGTNGKPITKHAATSSTSSFAVKGASTTQSAVQTKNRARGYELAHIDQANLHQGDLVIKGITARANVSRGKRVTADIKGTDVQSFTANGQSYPASRLDGYTIPGVLQVDTNVVTRTANGIEVVAVRVRFLDGSGAVVDLGHAMLQIRPVSSK